MGESIYSLHAPLRHDHRKLKGIGTNTHAQLDLHVVNISNPHSVTKAQVLTGNLIVNADVALGAAIDSNKLDLSLIDQDITLATGRGLMMYGDEVTPVQYDIFWIQGGELLFGSGPLLPIRVYGPSITLDCPLIISGTGRYLQLASLTTTQRDALTPANGMKLYNSTTNKFQCYEGGAWKNEDTGITVETDPVFGASEAASFAANGWLASGETWTYWFADDPTYTFRISGDKTSKYSPGMRVKLTQTSVKYFIMTAVTYSDPYTYIEIYGGTDYDLANAAITESYYSTQKAPQGFPMSPTKWTVEMVDITEKTQATPTQNVWYNVGSLSLSVPIGSWIFGWKGCINAGKVATTSISVKGTLSTTVDGESDADYSAYAYMETGSATLRVMNTVDISKPVILASKTTYYLNVKTDLTGVADIGIRGDLAKTVVRAVCAYL